MITNDDALTGLEDFSVAGELAAEDRLDPATLELVKRLDKSMRVCAAALGQRRVRSLTDLYYQTQKLRISTANQCRGTGEPTEVFAWLTDALKTIEHDICLTLGQFVRRYRCGNWLLSQCGIGPVIAAGLMSHLDVRQARTAGHYWSFAGLTQRPWEKGHKRPWNDRLKSLVGGVFRQGAGPPKRLLWPNVCGPPRGRGGEHQGRPPRRRRRDRRGSSGEIHGGLRFL